MINWQLFQNAIDLFNALDFYQVFIVRKRDLKKNLEWGGGPLKVKLWLWFDKLFSSKSIFLIDYISSSRVAEEDTTRCHAELTFCRGKPGVENIPLMLFLSLEIWSSLLPVELISWGRRSSHPFLPEGRTDLVKIPLAEKWQNSQIKSQWSSDVSQW